MDNMQQYFSGERLYGDDFELDGIRQWYDEEREGYANLGAKDKSQYRYQYHEMNRQHGYRHLPDQKWGCVLGLGSAHGDEFEPIKDRIEDLVILEPSDAFPQTSVHGIPVRYIKPTVEGDIPFPDQTFELETSFGVLHHIPNVTHVVSELYRCLKIDGYALIREPIVSLGDWRRPRVGGTRNERGIPLPLFRQILNEAGFRIVQETLCVHAVVRLLWPKVFRKSPYNSRLATGLDAFLSRWTASGIKYHRASTLDKLKPAGVYYVLTKHS